MHHFGYLMLALLECEDGVPWCGELLARTAYPRAMEVDFLESQLAIWVFFQVDVLDDLVVSLAKLVFELGGRVSLRQGGVVASSSLFYHLILQNPRYKLQYDKTATESR